jgi:hypothetical protein
MPTLKKGVEQPEPTLIGKQIVSYMINRDNDLNGKIEKFTIRFSDKSELQITVNPFSVELVKEVVERIRFI